MKVQELHIKSAFALLLIGLSGALVVLGLHDLRKSRATAVRLAEVESQNLARAIDQSVTATLRRVDHTLRSVTAQMERNLASGRLDLAQMKQVLALEERLLPEAVAIRVADARGTVILNNPSDNPSASFADRPFFPVLRDNPEAGLFVTKPILGLFTKKWVITSARRFNLPDGRFGGVVVVPVFLEHFEKALYGFEVGAGGMLVLRDRDGGFVARFPTVVKGKTLAVGDKTFSSELKGILDSGVSQATYSAVAPFDQTRRNLTFRRIEPGGFFVVASLAEEDYLAAWGKERFKTLTVIALVIAGAWGMGAFLWRSLNERGRFVKALWESEERFRVYVEQSIDVIFTLDAKGTFTFISPAWERHFGYPTRDVVGKPFSPFVHPEDIQPCMDYLTQVLSTGQSRTSPSYRVRHADGSWRRFVANGTRFVTPVGEIQFMGVAHDITDTKRAEEERLRLQAQLHQVQKMESLGSLASGVAHDMNNVLGAILGLASVHLETQPEGTPLWRAFDTISKAAERGGHMVKSLLAFSRQSPAEKRELDVNQLLREVVGLLERTTLSKIRLEIDLAPDLRPVLGDGSALTHMFINLCVNAVDAMPDRGTLMLRSKNTSDQWIEVFVEDTGTGMPKEVLDRALDPFFTTKEFGKGTGLGLSMAYSTIQAHQGQLDIQSELGRGTLVKVRFPAWEGIPTASPSVKGIQSGSSPRALTVLLVDDDELIRESSGSMLGALGHDNHVVASGEAALAKLEAGFEPEVVVLDMNMPGLSGAETLKRLRAMRPTLPVLLATGRSDQTALELVEYYPYVALLPKPFGKEELCAHLMSIAKG